MGFALMCRIFLSGFSSLLILVCSVSCAVVVKDEEVASIFQKSYPSGDPRTCLKASGGSANVARFEVLPGGGYDNLRNLDAGQAVTWAFHECKTTEDGKYLIPDSVFIVPIKSSHLQVFAELIDHWTKYSSVTSNSINADLAIGFAHVGISGKFSSEFESVKKHQAEEKTMTTRVQVRHNFYTAKLQPDAPLHPTFKARLMNIAAHLQNNNTEVARYLSQLLVRDYGTHVVTSINAGAALVKEDQVKSTFTSDYSSDKSSISASASASFFSIVKFETGFSKSTTKEFQDQYSGNMTHSAIKTYGGPAFRANFTIGFWEDGLQNELVAVDRSGDPLHFLVTSATLPELPDPTIRNLALLVQEAILMYYKFNTYRGCTALDSPNFSFQANIDDGSCDPPLTNFTFGGVFQTCRQTKSGAGDLCSSIKQVNPLTGDFSCPSGYQQVLLHGGTKRKSFSRHECERKCHRCWLFFKCCHNACGDRFYASAVNYEAYWCSAVSQVQGHSGYLFGGLFSSTMVNPLTGSPTCPIQFYPLRLGTELHVCVSDDYELGGRYSLPFAGFFSCIAGNPLATGQMPSALKAVDGGKDIKLTLLQFVEDSGPIMWPHRCPKGFSQHLAALDQGCEINYCARTGSLGDKSLPNIRRPPFTDHPGDNPNSTNTLVIYGVAGKIWVKNDTTDTWVRMDKHDDTTLEIWAKRLGLLKTDGKSVRLDESKSDNISPGAAAGIGVAATIICGLALVLVAVKCRKRRARQPRDNTARPSSHLESFDQRYGTLEENHC